MNPANNKETTAPESESASMQEYKIRNFKRVFLKTNSLKTAHTITKKLLVRLQFFFFNRFIMKFYRYSSRINLIGRLFWSVGSVLRLKIRSNFDIFLFTFINFLIFNIFHISQRSTTKNLCTLWCFFFFISDDSKPNYDVGQFGTFFQTPTSAPSHNM